jgi:hypothetical protein
MPALRGTAPTSSAQFAPANASLASDVRTTRFSSGKRGLQLEQLQVDLRMRTERLPRSDPEEERVADLAGGAGYGDFHV